MSCDGCPDSNIHCLFISHFTYHDHVRVLSQNRAQGRRECKAGFGIDLNLGNSVHNFLSRILHRDYVNLLFHHPVYGSVQGGCLSASSGTCHQNHTVRRLKDMLKYSSLFFPHSQTPYIHQRVIPVISQKPENCFLSINGGKGGDSQVCGHLTPLIMIFSILRKTFFSNIHAGHQLKPGYHGTVIFHFKCSMDHQVPVDSDTDDQIILSRLHMNVTGIFMESLLYHHIDHAYHGSAFHPLHKCQL